MLRIQPLSPERQWDSLVRKRQSPAYPALPRQGLQDPARGPVREAMSSGTCSRGEGPLPTGMPRDTFVVVFRAESRMMRIPTGKAMWEGNERQKEHFERKTE